MRLTFQKFVLCQDFIHENIVVVFVVVVVAVVVGVVVGKSVGGERMYVGF